VFLDTIYQPIDLSIGGDSWSLRVKMPGSLAMLLSDFRQRATLCRNLKWKLAEGKALLHCRSSCRQRTKLCQKLQQFQETLKLGWILNKQFKSIYTHKTTFCVARKRIAWKLHWFKYNSCNLLKKIASFGLPLSGPCQNIYDIGIF